jgi:hypothetical protein
MSSIVIVSTVVRRIADYKEFYIHLEWQKPGFYVLEIYDDPDHSGPIEHKQYQLAEIDKALRHYNKLVKKYLHYE